MAAILRLSRTNGLKAASTTFAARGNRTPSQRLSFGLEKTRPYAIQGVLLVFPASRSFWSSSKPQPVPPVTDPQTTATPHEGVTTSPVNSGAEPPVETIDSPAAIDIPPLQYGDLGEMGLISWTPAGFVRWTLELVQVSTGAPWFHTIVLTTMFYRALLVPLSIKSLQNSVRLLPMAPRLAALREEMEAARQSRDMLLMQRVALKQKQVYSDAGISLTPMLVNPFVQLPVTLGLFFGIRKMCVLPVEQLKQSGLAILPDLTVPDPYFILPVLATALINLQIVVGAREMNLIERPEAGHMMNVLRALSILGVYFMGTLPSGVMVSLTTGVAAITLQSILLQIKPIRRMLNIPIVSNQVQGRLPTFRQTVEAGIKWFRDTSDAAAAAGQAPRTRPRRR